MPESTTSETLVQVFVKITSETLVWHTRGTTTSETLAQTIDRTIVQRAGPAQNAAQLEASPP